MINRSTIITFKIPAAFEVVRTESAKNGAVIGYGRNNRMSFDGLEIVSISRRGHVDPAKMRDLAIAKGATGADELTVTHHQDRARVATYLVRATGEAKPIKVMA